MKKNTWIKPEFEIEAFVPNNYIAACPITIGPAANMTGYAFVDGNNNQTFDGILGQIDTSQTDEFGSSPMTNYVPNGDPFLNNYAYPQTLPTPQSEMPGITQYTIKYNAVFLSDGSSTPTPYNAVKMDIEGEAGMVFYTPNRPSNNS